MCFSYDLSYSRQVGGAKRGAEMSRSDNTRPIELQWDDSTIAGQVQHNHTSRHVYRAEDGTLKHYFELHECDYSPSNNTVNFRAKKHAPRFTRTPMNCQRVTFKYGGKNSIGGHAKKERKLRRRKLRRREYAALWQARRLNYRGAPKNNYSQEFDIPPIREDARTIGADLS